MSHSLVKIYVHLVWSTRNLQPTIEAAWRDRLYGAIIQSAEKAGCLVNEIGETNDHVHALLRLSGTVSMAQAAQRLKGSSSHFVNHQILPK